MWERSTGSLNPRDTDSLSKVLITDRTKIDKNDTRCPIMLGSWRGQGQIKNFTL
jgi:hypothetical protein